MYKGNVLINWTGKYVSRYQATFYQMQVFGYLPFHYYITLPAKNPISLNFKLFDQKIEKAVSKVKSEMAIKYNLSIEDKVALDDEYLQFQSFWFDMKILLITILKVFKRDNISH